MSRQLRSVLLRSGAVAIVASIAPVATCFAQQDTTGRSAVAAGLLSYLLPGTGSLYAGNGRHALVHAAIDIGSIVAFASAVTDKCPAGRCSTSTQVRGFGGLIVFSANSVWSIVTAVQDANAHNAALASHRARDSVARLVPERDRPLGFGFRGVHVGLGGGVGPYLDKWTGAQTSEGRVGVTLFRDWTFAYTGSAVRPSGSTDYFVPACDAGRGCHPRVMVEADAFEVQRRWRRGHRLHPIVTASVGNVSSRYSYPRGLAFEAWAEDSVQYRRFASASAGLEADVWGWFHTAALGGYRQSTGGTIPNGKSANSGPVLAWLLEIGKF